MGGHKVETEELSFPKGTVEGPLCAILFVPPAIRLLEGQGYHPKRTAITCRGWLNIDRCKAGGSWWAAQCEASNIAANGPCSQSQSHWHTTLRASTMPGPSELRHRGCAVLSPNCQLLYRTRRVLRTMGRLPPYGRADIGCQGFPLLSLQPLISRFLTGLRFEASAVTQNTSHFFPRKNHATS